MGLRKQLLCLRWCHCQARQPFSIGFQTFYVLLKARPQKDLYVTAEGFRGDSVTLLCRYPYEACFLLYTFMLSLGSNRAYPGANSHKLAAEASRMFTAPLLEQSLFSSCCGLGKTSFNDLPDFTEASEYLQSSKARLWFALLLDMGSCLIAGLCPATLMGTDYKNPKDSTWQQAGRQSPCL